MDLLLQGLAGPLFRGDIRDQATIEKAVKGVDRVCHLAALAGVRYSLEHPEEYMENNILGFFRVLEAVKKSACN